MFFNKKEEIDETEKRIVNDIKALNVDIINKRKNGNYNFSLGLINALYVLFGKHLRFDKNNPNWLNRDRVVLSSYSGYSALLSTLYMVGLGIDIEKIKEDNLFFDSIPGIDFISDSFGEGIATSVGMAIGERYLHKFFENSNENLVNFRTYLICSNLDIVKGISYESLTLAGTLNLRKLIVLYDNNSNAYGNSEKNNFNIDMAKYFDSLNFGVISVNKNNIIEIDNAIEKAKANDKPTIIILNEEPNLKYESNYIENNFMIDDSSITKLKNDLEVRDIPFTVSSETVEKMQELVNERLNDEITNWNKLYESLDDSSKDIINKINESNLALLDTNINYDLVEEEYLYESSTKVLNYLIKNNNLFIGSVTNINNINIKELLNHQEFTATNYSGNIIDYGLRNELVSAISIGLSLVGIRNFSITSLKNSYHLIPSIITSAKLNIPNIYIFIEDSDTYLDNLVNKSKNSLIALRDIPNTIIYRPNDANEMIGIYKEIAINKTSPVCIILGRNKTKIKENSSINDVKKGAYIIKKEEKNISAIIISSGADLDIALDVSEELKEKGYDIRVISMVSTNVFNNQKDTYKEELLPLGTKVFVIEKSSKNSWYKFVYNDKYLITEDLVDWNQENLKEFITLKIENLLK